MSKYCSFYGIYQNKNPTRVVSDQIPPRSISICPFFIDSILQHGWVSGLTIPKVLISIQSLLTDPYTEVCMEPEIGRLYKTQRKMFDAVARIWTWKYAMWDALAAKPKG